MSWTRLCKLAWKHGSSPEDLDSEYELLDFPGGAVDKNLPASAGDMGSIPHPGRSHVLWSN